jgi:flagellar FliL protein
MNKKLVLILAAVLVLLGGGGAVAFLLMRGTPADAAAVESHVPPGIVEMDTFLVNINDSGGGRFAKLGLKLTVSPGESVAHIEEDHLLQAQMRDRVLTLLTAKTLDELVGPLGKETLRREIKAYLEPLLKPATIEEVLFAEFVVQ